MFLGMQNDLIAMTTETAEELENIDYMTFTEIVETEDNYVLENGVYVKQDSEYFEKKLAELKAQKTAENQHKLDVARNSHIFYVELQGENCEFDTKDKTQNDLNSASIAIGLGLPWAWTTNNRVVLTLTADDIQAITQEYMAAVNSDIQKWTEYDAAIEQAETIEEAEEINIDYGSNDD